MHQASTVWIIALLLCASMMIACSDSNEDPDFPSMTTDTSDTEDQELRTPQDTVTDSSLIDWSRERQSSGQACTEHLDCQRGLICLQGSCQRIVSCARSQQFPFASEPTGCYLQKETGTSPYSAIECNSDDDCVGSPEGKTCIMQVCSTLQACSSDTDCTRSGEQCWQEIACVNQ